METNTFLFSINLSMCYNILQGHFTEAVQMVSNKCFIIAKQYIILRRFSELSVKACGVDGAENHSNAEAHWITISVHRGKLRWKDESSKKKKNLAAAVNICKTAWRYSGTFTPIPDIRPFSYDCILKPKSEPWKKKKKTKEELTLNREAYSHNGFMFPTCLPACPWPQSGLLSFRRP